MPDFSKHSTMINELEKSQNSNHDMRENVRDAHLFIIKRDGQWEPYWWNQKKDEPRYTFDLTTPVIDDIAGEMEKADFAITIDPADGEGSKEDAETLNGMIRNIQNLSKATNIFNAV